MEPPAGAAPAELLYKRSSQAAARRRKWSQSPVLPWTQRAYETCLSAGSTAFGLWKWSPHPELHQAGLLTEQGHRWQCFGGIENGRRETSGLPKPSKMDAPNGLARYREQ